MYPSFFWGLTAKKEGERVCATKKPGETLLCSTSFMHGSLLIQKPEIEILAGQC